MSSFSSFLFARPSFIEGVARIVDVGGTLNVYNVAPDGATADAWASAADWQAVGDCMKQSILRYSRSLDKRSSRNEGNPGVQKVEATK
jgi:hypothetical protein